MAGQIPAQPGSTIAAFFDLDKTIIAKSSALAFGRHFLHGGLISRHAATQLTLEQLRYSLHGYSAAKMDAMKDKLLKMATGWEVEKVRAIATAAQHEVLTPAIYREARELIKQHQQAGHLVVIVSASLEDLVWPIAKELGINQVIASSLEVDSGRYTGKLLFYCKGHGKVEKITEFAQTYGVDLAASYAYSDSATDQPMLELVGNPQVVNPDRALRKLAAQRQWPVQVFANPEPLFAAPRAGKVAAVAAGTGLIAVLLWRAAIGMQRQNSVR